MKRLLRLPTYKFAEPNKLVRMEQLVIQRDRPITVYNKEQRLFSLVRKLKYHAENIRVYAGWRPMLNPDKRAVTIAIRCINDIARALARTNSRPIKGSKK